MGGSADAPPSSAHPIFLHTHPFQQVCVVSNSVSGAGMAFRCRGVVVSSAFVMRLEKFRSLANGRGGSSLRSWRRRLKPSRNQGSKGGEHE
jgi:hypothetical protein